MTLQIRAIPRRQSTLLSSSISLYHDITNPGNPQTSVVDPDDMVIPGTMT